MTQVSCVDDFTHTTPKEKGLVTFDIALLAIAFRAMGSLLILAAASTFMFHHWDQGDDLKRYGLLLGLTTLIASMGWFCGWKIREARSARTFFLLHLAATPIHFAVLGALIRSVVTWDGQPLPSGDMAIWTAPSLWQAVGMTALGSLFLFPINHLSFKVTARSWALPMGITFLATNAILLLPVRQPEVCVAISTITLIALGFLSRKQKELLSFWTTLEGKLLLLFFCTPPLVVLGRTVLLYELTPQSVGLSLLALNLLTLLLTPSRWTKWPAWKVAEGILMMGIIPAAFLCAASWLEMSPWTLPTSAIAVSLLTALAAFKRPQQSWFLTPLTLGVIAFCVWQHILYPGALALLFATLLSSVFLAIACLRQSRTLLVLSCLQVGLSFASFIERSINFSELNHWGTLSALGVGLILCAAALERNHQRILQAWGHTLKAWEKWGQDESGTVEHTEPLPATNAPDSQ